jgi:hypothetical protein
MGIFSDPSGHFIFHQFDVNSGYETPQSLCHICVADPAMQIMRDVCAESEIHERLDETSGRVVGAILCHKNVHAEIISRF